MHLRENEHSTFEAQAIQKDQETANRMMKDKRRTLLHKPKQNKCSAAP